MQVLQRPESLSIGEPEKEEDMGIEDPACQ